MSASRSIMSAFAGALSLAAVVASDPALAQSTGGSAPSGNTAPGAATLGSGEIAAPGASVPTSAAQGDAAAPDVPLVDPIDSNLVDVSLGDWTLKNELAAQLKVRVSQIPLTVAVSSQVASQVCPVSNNDLAQQKVTSATLTCAAKTITDELRDQVSTQLRDPDAN